MPTPLLKRNTVLQILGVNTSTLTKWVRQGLFPPPVLLRPSMPVWPEDEVQAWISNRPRQQAEPRGRRRQAISATR